MVVWTKTTPKMIGSLTLSMTSMLFTTFLSTPASCPGFRIISWWKFSPMWEVLFFRADLWALAGIVAVDEAIKNANNACKEKQKTPNHGGLNCTLAPASGLVFSGGRKVGRNLFWKLPRKFSFLSSHTAHCCTVFLSYLVKCWWSTNIPKKQNQKSYSKLSHSSWIFNSPISVTILLQICFNKP